MTTETSQVTIREASDVDATAWDSFVLEQEKSTFFHRFGWSRVISETYGYQSKYLIAENAISSEIVGVLPLIEVKSLFFGRSLISTAFTVGGGILAINHGAEVALAAKAVEIGEAHGVNYVELRGGNAPIDWQVKEDVYAGFEKDLPEEEAENLALIPRKKRADLRKGIAAAGEGQVAVRIDPDIDGFYHLYAASLRTHGTPVFPKKLVQLLVDTFSDTVEISFVEAEGKTSGTLLSFYHQGTVMPYYNGAAPSARKLHAVDYLYWRQMRHAVETRGATRFDFGRSKQGSGPYDYKTYWGFEPKPLCYHYKLVKADAVPDINPNNPKFSLATKVWQKLPLSITNCVGPFLAGNLA